jgi:hypothetical protein
MSDAEELLARPQWDSYLESLTKEREGDPATIEVVSDDVGDQVEAEPLPLAYLEYDRHDDVVIVGVGGRDRRYPVLLRHFIYHPVCISVRPSLADPAALEVETEHNTATLITLYRTAASSRGC